MAVFEMRATTCTFPAHRAGSAGWGESALALDDGARFSALGRKESHPSTFSTTERDHTAISSDGEAGNG